MCVCLLPWVRPRGRLSSSIGRTETSTKLDHSIDHPRRWLPGRPPANDCQMTKPKWPIIFVRSAGRASTKI